jgi:hypothetical protein
VAGVVLLLEGAGLSAADLTGTWALEFQRDANSPLYAAECSLVQEANRLSGSCLSGFESVQPVRGTIDGKSVSFRLTLDPDGEVVLSFSGTLDDRETSIAGAWRSDQKGNTGDGTFTAKKR